jgi:hypothetical protein
MNLEQRQAIEFFHAGHRPDRDWLLEMKAETPRLFGYTPPSRGQLRELPMKFILWGRPGLVWPDDSPAVLLIHDLEDCRSLFMRFRGDEQKRKMIAIKARRTWCKLVELATGIRVQISSAPITFAVLEFTE